MLWQVAITPNDGTQDGTTVLSNNITILNSLPIANEVILNSTFNTNLTTENLTVHFTTSDVDGDTVINITDWRVNDVSIALLNYPFENHSSASSVINDYSVSGNGNYILGSSGHSDRSP